ncbi:Os02g0832866 [Oryza sativa Japonica Group]|jgi:hypothetical protein|uniref:Os02g0832866 protein n=1 Tax=Oryza sativa subsp. japonica TaxID=39947 RepID=A0A0N7KGE3_ORYSJ|nr:Os02g0832866 [Oryza sativa Japonica Group]
MLGRKGRRRRLLLGSGQGRAGELAIGSAPAPYLHFFFFLFLCGPEEVEVDQVEEDAACATAAACAKEELSGRCGANRWMAAEEGSGSAPEPTRRDGRRRLPPQQGKCAIWAWEKGEN